MTDIAKNAEPMEPDTVRREVSSDEAGAYTAQTTADALPYGTYDVRETATNGSYLLTDGEPRTFEVCAGRGLQEDRGRHAGLMAPFAIENAATGETHVLVTDRNRDASTANSWNRHSRDTNANDALLGHEDPIVADDMDPEAGIWFLLGENGSSAPVDDSLAVLPYGAYTMTELRCDANEGLELITRSSSRLRPTPAARSTTTETRSCRSKPHPNWPFDPLPLYLGKGSYICEIIYALDSNKTLPVASREASSYP